MAVNAIYLFYIYLFLAFSKPA